MISQEFKTVVSNKNLLRTKIMLKDSFVVDPTFIQFNEMLDFAESRLPNLFVSFDNEYLENDISKWNRSIMNEELVQLVDNFSRVRIEHLKKVVSKVLVSEAEKIRCKSKNQNIRSVSSPQSKKTPNVREDHESTKKRKRAEALSDLQKAGKEIQKIMTEVTSQDNRTSWKPTNVDDMKSAARKIIKAADKYKNNK